MALSLSGNILKDPAAHESSEAEWPETTAVAYALDGRMVGYSRPGIDIVNLEPGDYRIQVSARDPAGRWAPVWYGNTPFESQATVVHLRDAPITNLDVTISHAGSISGILGPQDAAATGAQATAYLFDPVAHSYAALSSATIDSSGHYLLPRLAAGSYAVQFSQTTDLPTFADQYFGGSTQPDGAALVTVAPDLTTENIDAALVPWSTSVERLGGADRFETAVAVSKKGFTPNVPVVYVANGLNWPDALSAGPAAAFLGGPLLLVSPDRLPADVAAELSRLRPRRIVVVGGNASVSDAVFSEIAKLAPIVDRVGGSDRYETSRAVIRDAFGSHIESRALFVATGRNFPDALSAGYGAGKLKAPVLLVDGIQTGLDQATHDLLSNTIFGTVEIIGGPAAVSPGLALDLTHVTKWEYVSREGGVDRYDTNRIANNAYGGYTPHSGFAFVASGTGFADALAAVPVAVKESAPLFLAPPGCMPGETLAEMHHLHAHDITILGGPQALSAAVEGLVTC